MDADKLAEQATRLLYKAIDALLIEGPKTTGYGTLLGLIVYGLLKGFSPSLQRMRISEVFDVTQLPLLFYPAAGVLAANSVSWMIRLVRKPTPPGVKSAFIAIEEAKRRANLGSDEVKARYLRVIDDYIESLRGSSKPEIEKPKPSRKPARTRKKNS